MNPHLAPWEGGSLFSSLALSNSFLFASYTFTIATDPPPPHFLLLGRLISRLLISFPPLFHPFVLALTSPSSTVPLGFEGVSSEPSSPKEPSCFCSGVKPRERMLTQCVKIPQHLYRQGSDCGGLCKWKKEGKRGEGRNTRRKTWECQNAQ